ncbi:aminotransferase [Micractinium conductrix]|uniref:Aminotransferase n=1 Tax=Micractinium conductrix TaxID=554055 RepID=A0A2P6UZV8_9CHLO|nr:aminotransferase [Micractinium conductrix]|eukprot:PSC67334.1 aminotransferase [Micractinium conductrix]
MTNIGTILPEPGFLAALRDACTCTGTLLIIDETHTICAGPGGMSRAEGLQPDIFVLGKPIAGGIPVAIYGFTADLAARLGGAIQTDLATLEDVLTEKAYSRMIALAQRFEAGVLDTIARHRLAWTIKRLGCRDEYWPAATAPRNGGQAAASGNERLDYYMHLAALNRGVYLTPFHNMALMCPATTAADVDRHTAVFVESVALLLGSAARSRL